MSKTTVKKHLSSMSKDDLLKIVLELYDAKKEAKEYLEYIASPNEKGKLKEYKEIITEEFYPYGRCDPKLRFAVCKKAISDYKKFKPSTKTIADLMLTFVECGCQFTYDYGDMWEQYYTVMENNFNATLKYITENDLLGVFKQRIDQCLKWTESCGWGFGDAIQDIYYEYVGDCK